MACRTRPIDSKFWSKVEKTPDCWKWLGGKNAAGYGIIGKGGRRGGFWKAHRLSWTIHNGPIPDNHFVLHKCDNPECTRPDHLFLGSQQVNMDDMWSKGRARPRGVNQAK